jgi:lipopolysaccharide transport system permease protein
VRRFRDRLALERTWASIPPIYPAPLIFQRSKDIMLADLRILFHYRELLWMWILREIRVRYKQSILGAAWAILQPLSMMIIFTLVFSLLAKVPTDGIPYPIFSYSAVLPWTFFATSISLGVPSLVNNLNLVTKTYFPREILPLGAIGAGFLDLVIASTIFLIMFLIYRMPLTWALLWLPLILALQVMLMIGVALLGAAVNVLYRDVRFVVPLGLQLWLYASPVIYSVSLVPENLRPLYMLNPMAGIIDAYRQVLLYGEPPNGLYLGLSAAVAVVMFVAGYWVFKRLEVIFADII